mgnify:CR=1 FL=1
MLVALALGATLSTARAATADCTAAEAFVRAAADRTLAVLNAVGAGEAERLDGMSRLMFEVADIPLIARLVLGRHWRAASPEQRAAYLEAFRSYALDSLAARFSRLGVGVKLALAGRCVVDGEDALVPSEVVMPTRPEPARIEWRVRRRNDGYRLIDVAIEGVSLVVSNRSEFDAVIGREGLDALIAQIRGRKRQTG